MPLEQWSVVGRAALDAHELGAAQRLIATCDAHDGLRLKMSVYARPSVADAADAAPSVFLIYAGAELAGCWSVDYDGGPEAEMCGAVLPEYRRRGIGSALFRAARESLRQRGASTVLLICEDSSASGRAFVRVVQGSPRHSELHMERPAEQPTPPPPAHPGVLVRPATRVDTDALVRVMTRAFGDDEAGVRNRVNGEVDDTVTPYLLISANGETVGSLKPYDLGSTIGLYAVGILPERQGHGYGKRLMLGAIEWLGARFPGKLFVLEVDPDNASAIALYERTGFVLTTTYGYYAV